jgi:hypothetical protein
VNKLNPFLFGVIVLILVACSKIDKQEIFTPPISSGNPWPQNETELSITNNLTSTLQNTSAETPSKYAKTRVFTPTQELIKLRDLPSGRYIVYSIIDVAIEDYKHYVVSEFGEELGLISTELAELHISPNQKYIAFVGSFKLGIFDIEKNEMRALPIDKGYFEGYGGLTWGPKSDQVGIANSEAIDIFSIADGKKVGIIANILNPLPESINWHQSPKWSPDGKWIAYYVLAGQMESPQSPGPYVTDTSCMSDPSSCDKKTKLIVNAIDQLIDWTPDNHLAVFDKRDKIRIYDVVTSSLLQEIELPDEIGYSEFFIWSNDEEWVAFSGRCGVCIMSIKTGETKVLTTKGIVVQSWYIVP